MKLINADIYIQILPKRQRKKFCYKIDKSTSSSFIERKKFLFSFFSKDFKRIFPFARRLDVPLRVLNLSIVLYIFAFSISFSFYFSRRILRLTRRDLKHANGVSCLPTVDDRAGKIEFLRRMRLQKLGTFATNKVPHVHVKDIHNEEW